MLKKSPIDGYWEEGYHYYLEIKGHHAVLRDYAKRIILETTIHYDKKTLKQGKRTPLMLGEVILSRTARGEPMTWIKNLYYENGKIVMDYYYTIMGDKTYLLYKVDHGPFDHILIRDKEVLPRIQGLWLEWSKSGINEKKYGIRIKGDTLRYGSKDYDMFSARIHAISYKGNPEKIWLTPADLTVSEFRGMTRITLEKDILTSYRIVCDVSSPMSVFVREENYSHIVVPEEALREAKNMMLIDDPESIPVKDNKISMMKENDPQIAEETNAIPDSQGRNQ